MAKKESGVRSSQQNDFLQPFKPEITGVTDIGTNRPYNDGAVSVSFSLPAGSPPATMFYVYDSSNTLRGSGTQSPILAEGLPTYNTDYIGTGVIFYVVAENESGQSEPSEFSPGRKPTGVPATMSAPTVSSTVANQDQVSWTAPGDGGKVITNYYWESSDGKSGNTTSTSITVAQEAGTSQTYKVRAENANGLGIWSADSSSVTTVSPFFPFFPPFFPFFPPFFPFFPPFFPFFPFFPPFFPFFPPFFPFFPPFFPFFPSFPSFKSAPTAELSSSSMVLYSTEEFGFLADKYLSEGDSMISIDIESENYDNTLTNIIFIEEKETFYSHVSINSITCLDTHSVFVEKDGVRFFENSSLIDESYKIFNVDSKTFDDVEYVEVSETSYSKQLFINCENNSPFIVNSFLAKM